MRACFGKVKSGFRRLAESCYNRGRCAQSDAQRLHGTVLPIETVTSIVGLLAGMAVDEIARLPGVPADRAGWLLAGAVIVEQVLATVGVSEVTVSTSGLIDALARRVATRID